MCFPSTHIIYGFISTFHERSNSRNDSAHPLEIAVPGSDTNTSGEAGYAPELPNGVRTVNASSRKEEWRTVDVSGVNNWEGEEG